MTIFTEAFLRDFFRMPPAEKPKPAPVTKPREMVIECRTTDPIEIRAENIVKAIGFAGGGGSFSIPRISPAEATLRAIMILRKYAEQDNQKSEAK